MPQRDQPGKPYPPLLSETTLSAVTKNVWILEQHGLPRKEAVQVAQEHQHRQIARQHKANRAKHGDAKLRAKMNTPPNTRTTFS